MKQFYNVSFTPKRHFLGIEVLTSKGMGLVCIKGNMHCNLSTHKKGFQGRDQSVAKEVSNVHYRGDKLMAARPAETLIEPNVKLCVDQGELLSNLD